MIRSFWRIPRTSWLDKDGNKIFGNVVVYDETAQYLYVIAAETIRPDIEAVGTFLSFTVDRLTTTDKARFLRVEVERDTPNGKIRTLVKDSDKKLDDVEIRADVPYVMWMGDDPKDYLP